MDFVPLLQQVFFFFKKLASLQTGIVIGQQLHTVFNQVKPVPTCIFPIESCLGFFLENVRLWGRKQTIHWNSSGLAEVRLCHAIMYRKQGGYRLGMIQNVKPKISWIPQNTNSVLFGELLAHTVSLFLKQDLEISISWQHILYWNLYMTIIFCSYHPTDNPLL